MNDDDSKKMLRAIINGQSAMKKELVQRMDKIEKKLDNLIGKLDKIEKTFAS
jgi:hypothetical protein